MSDDEAKKLKKLKDSRRVYYDHEPAYRQIAEHGGEGWDDRPQPNDSLKDDAFGSYVSLQDFLESEWVPEPVNGATEGLELGCGGGQACFMLAQRGYKMTGVDFAETAVELARANAEREGYDCTFERADVTDLSSFDSATFRLVVDNHCLHCLVEPEDRAAMLAEACRVLRDDGVFFSSTMSAEGDFDAAAMGVDPDTRRSAHNTRIWVTEEELRGELAAAGLSIVAMWREPQEPKTGDVINFVARSR